MASTDGDCLHYKNANDQFTETDADDLVAYLVSTTANDVCS